MGEVVQIRPHKRPRVGDHQLVHCAGCGGDNTHHEQR